MGKAISVMLSSMLLVALSCTKPDNGNNTGNGDEPETAIKLGDYYSNGLVKGIVFSLDEDGKHGMVVSLDEKKLQWSTLETSLIAGAAYVSLDYGLDNVAGIKTLFDNWATDFPAVAWCSSKNPGSLNLWYLPAANELRLLLDGFAGNPELGASMERHSGSPLKPEVSYWSSTDAGGQIAYSYRHRGNMSPEEDLYALLPKSESLPSRCICRF